MGKDKIKKEEKRSGLQSWANENWIALERLCNFESKTFLIIRFKETKRNLCNLELS